MDSFCRWGYGETHSDYKPADRFDAAASPLWYGRIGFRLRCYVIQNVPFHISKMAWSLFNAVALHSMKHGWWTTIRQEHCGAYHAVPSTSWRIHRRRFGTKNRRFAHYHTRELATYLLVTSAAAPRYIEASSKFALELFSLILRQPNGNLIDGRNKEPITLPKSSSYFAQEQRVSPLVYHQRFFLQPHDLQVHNLNEDFHSHPDFPTGVAAA